MAKLKPLSASTLKKRYAELGLPEETVVTLGRFFNACANLYGVLSVSEAWDVYRKVLEKQGLPLVRRKELVAFSQVAMRDDSYLFDIYKMSDIFSEEEDTPSNCLIIAKELVMSGVGLGDRKFGPVYNVNEAQFGKDFYIPQDILYFEKDRTLEQAKKLYSYLCNLKVTQSDYLNNFGIELKCVHKGEKLKDFVNISFREQFDIEYYSKLQGAASKKYLKQMEEERCSNEAEKLIRNLKFDQEIGNGKAPMRPFRNFMEELNECGVAFSDSEIDKLTSLVMDFLNNTNLKSNRGWTPSELEMNAPGQEGPVVMKLGKEMLKAFEKDGFSREDIIQRFAEMGVIVEF